MHTIQPAHLKPGVSADRLPEGEAASAAGPARLIRGTALIFWEKT